MAPMFWTVLLLFLGSACLAGILSNMASAFRSAGSVGETGTGELPRIAVLIPARNAAHTIAPLLQDLHAQDYPKERTEVIVVDDASEDATMHIVAGMQRNWKQLQVLKASGTGKKAAIGTGVARSTAELVLLTDADARCGPQRLAALAEHWCATGSRMVLMPVRTSSAGGCLGRLQEDEQAALSGFGLGGAALGWYTIAYGANLAFVRSAFEAIGGYAGDPFASGDDVFLLQRMRAAGGRVTAFVDDRVVVTVGTERTWRGFLSQRIRWAGKMKGAAAAVQLAGVLVLAMPYLLLWTTLSFNPVQAMGEHALQTTALLITTWCLLIIPIVRLAGTVRRFFGQATSVPIALVSYLTFLVYAPVIAIVSRFVRPRWKGRRIH